MIMQIFKTSSAETVKLHECQVRITIVVQNQGEHHPMRYRVQLSMAECKSSSGIKFCIFNHIKPAFGFRALCTCPSWTCISSCMYTTCLPVPVPVCLPLSHL